MDTILKLLLSNKSIIANILLLLALASAGIYIRILNLENSNLEKDVVSLKNKLRISDESIKELQGKIDDQNKAIDKLKKDSDDREKAHASEIAIANAKAGSYKQQASDILKMMSQNPDKCKASDDAINMEILKNVKK